MNFYVMTLFPEMIEQGLNTSIIGRAIEKNLLSLKAVNIRDYTLDKHKRVDDYPYGGGAGMVLMCEPVVRAIEDLKTDDSLVILTCPQGNVYNEKIAYDLTKHKHLIILSTVKASISNSPILSYEIFQSG